MSEKREFGLRAGIAPMILAGLLSAQVAKGESHQANDAEEHQASGDEDRLGWHVVRPGETLDGITEQYLGTPTLWRENWKLNPDLADPDFLRIGQRLRVILERKLPLRTAEIKKISNQVDAKPQPNPWTPAQVGSLLKERDGVRTHEDSSAELGFDDDSRLLITEQSLVFLTEMSATVTGVRREAIEIVEGQADLEARPTRPNSADIEIVMGDATAKPRPGSEGVSRTRARRPEAGGAAVMVFGGRAEVEASGSSVEVPVGMGTSVPEGGPPAPPEKLLPAPRLSHPPHQSAWEFANPLFSWSEIDAAASYTVEICADEDCGELIKRTAGITVTSWSPESLPLGSFHWRVSAVSASGLDGFPSRSLALSVSSATVDREPPVVAAVLNGPGHVTDDGALVLGDGGRIVLEAHDDASGVAEVRYRWNGGDWSPWDRGELRPPTLARVQKHRLEVEAVDRLGRQSPLWAVDVEEDLDAPAAPSVEAAPAVSGRRGLSGTVSAAEGNQKD